MPKARIVLGVVVAFSLLTVVVVARAQSSARAGEDPADPVRLQQAYEAHLAANAAAQASSAASSLAAQTSDEAVFANNFGCADNFTFWMRDSITPLCQPRCASDADCTGDDGRCRILNVDDKSTAPPMLLVGDMSPDDIDAVMNNENATVQPIMLCDPFFDVVGATDADLGQPE